MMIVKKLDYQTKNALYNSFEKHIKMKIWCLMFVALHVSKNF